MTGPTGSAEPGWFDVVAADVAYRGYSTVHVDTLRMPDGSEAVREYVENFDAVAVVPLLDDGSVLLLRQYRHPHRRYLLEIPAGKLDVDGEDPRDAAQRELVEEIGYAASALDHLITFENSAGWTTETTHVFLGSGLVEEAPGDDYVAKAEEADMEVVRLPFDAAVEMARQGELGDAKTVIGLLLAGVRRGL